MRSRIASRSASLVTVIGKSKRRSALREKLMIRLLKTVALGIRMWLPSKLKRIVARLVRRITLP